MRKKFAAILFVISCFGFIEAQEEQKIESVEMISVNISNSCSMFVVGWEGKVFEDKETFDKAIAGGKLNCASETMPKIDFQKYTLIGVGATVGNCAAGQTFVVTVKKDVTKKIYLVETMSGLGPCRGTSYMARWVLVPKLPIDYKIEFTKEPIEKDRPFLISKNS